MARPRRSVARVQANVALESAAADILRDQAEHAGMYTVTYLDHVISHAHRYSGPYLQDVSVLPEDLRLERLRRSVPRISTQSCTPAHQPAPRLFVKIDEPLADRLKERARGLGVHYTDYLRAVLRLAAGVSAASDQLQWRIEERGDALRAS